VATATSVLYPPSIRCPKIEHLGISYPHGLINIMLMNIVPTYEKKVIDAIDESLSEFHDSELIMQYAYKNKEGSSYDNEKRIQIVKDLSETDKEKNSILSKPMHVTIMGRFQLATIFFGPSYTECDFFPTLEHVNSVQPIIGGVPVSLHPKQFKYLKQHDPNKIVESFRHSECLGDGNLLPGTIKENPILVMCQLQVDPVLKMISPENMLLPLLYQIDKEIGVAKQCKEYGNAEAIGLLIDSYGWSDYVLMVRSSNINLCCEVISRVSKMTTKGLLEEWSDLDISKLSDEFNDPVREQKKAFLRRYKRITDKISVNNKVNIDDPSGLFVTTNSITGVIWPCSDYAVENPSVYESIRIEGEVRSNILIVNDTTIEGPMQTQLSQICNLEGKEMVTGGYSLDHILPGFLLLNNSKNPLEYYSLKKFISAAYAYRKQLINLDKKDFTFISIHDFCFDLISKISASEEQIPNLSNLFYKYLSEIKIGLEFFDIEGKFIESLKTRGVRRLLRRVLRQMISLWRRGFLATQSLSNMMELIDPLYVWYKQIQLMLNDHDFSLYEIDQKIRFFTQPFIQALEHRTLTGFYMSEHADLSTEFQGGLYDMITSLDGLIKAVMSLVSESFQASGLSIIGHEHLASVNIQKVIERHSDIEYICAVSQLSYVHMVHPGNIATVLHELLHVLVHSYAFKKFLASGKQFVELLHCIQSEHEDSKVGFYKERINEIIVEFLLGRLLFRGEEYLYSKCSLLQLFSNIESYAQEKDKMLPVVVEHITRVYLVENLLICSIQKKKFDFVKPPILFSEWYQKLSKHIDLPEMYTDINIQKYVSDVLQKLNAPLFLSIVNLIPLAIDNYFGESANKKDCIRYQFFDVLKKIQDNKTIEVCRLLFGDESNGPRPVHFVFNHENTFNTRSLRIRRLESLIGYLMLIRCYYIELFNLFDKTGIIYTRRKDDNLDFSNSIQNNGYLFDRTGECIFTIGDSTLKYITIREAFLKSMWHMTEIVKFSSLDTLCEIINKYDAFEKSAI